MHANRCTFHHGCGKRDRQRTNGRPTILVRYSVHMCQCPKVQAIAEHGLVSIHFICTLATRYTCVLVYRANPASGHGIVTLHDRYVTIPCPAFMTGVYVITIESMHGVDLHLGFYDLDCLWLKEPSPSPAPFNLNLMVLLNRSAHG